MTVKTKTKARSGQRWQFTLGSLLLLVITAAGVFAWISYRMKDASQIYIALTAGELRVNHQAIPPASLPATLQETTRQLAADGIQLHDATVHLYVADEVRYGELKTVIASCLDAKLNRFTLNGESCSRIPFELWPNEQGVDFPPLYLRLSADGQGELKQMHMGDRLVTLQQLRSIVINLFGPLDGSLEEVGFFYSEIQADDSLKCKHLLQACEQLAFYDDPQGRRQRLVPTIYPFDLDAYNGVEVYAKSNK